MSRHSKPRSDTKVDIIAVSYGKPEFLTGLYETLTAFDAGVSYNLTIVDNLSPDQAAMQPVYTMLETKPNVNIIRSPKNLGFAGGNNLGVDRSFAPYVLLLNTDIRIKHAGWLKAMTDELDASEDIGVVGARLLFFEANDLKSISESNVSTLNRVPGRVQHAGVAFNILGQAYHIFLGWTSENIRVTQRREMNAVTGACLMTRRRLYKEIGLNTAYGIGNFEDVEYCLHVRQKGYKIVYQPNACLYHYSGGSNNTATAQINGQLFMMRCRDLIRYDEYLYY